MRVPSTCKKLREPSRMRRPGGRGDEFPAGVSLSHLQVDEGSARSRDIGRNGRITAAGFALQHVGGGQQLRRVADRGDRFIGGGEVAHDIEHARIQADVLGSPPAGNHKRVVSSRA